MGCVFAVNLRTLYIFARQGITYTLNCKIFLETGKMGCVFAVNLRTLYIFARQGITYTLNCKIFLETGKMGCVFDVNMLIVYIFVRQGTVWLPYPKLQNIFRLASVAGLHIYILDQCLLLGAPHESSLT